MAGKWNLPRPDIEPMFPALTGGFLFTCATWEIQYFKIFLNVVLAHHKLLGNSLILSSLSFKLKRTRTSLV